MTEASSSTSRRQCRSCQPAQRAPMRPGSMAPGTHPHLPHSQAPGSRGMEGKDSPRAPCSARRCSADGGHRPTRPPIRLLSAPLWPQGFEQRPPLPWLDFSQSRPPCTPFTLPQVRAKREKKSYITHPSIHPSNPTGQTTTLCFCVIAKPHTLLVSIPRKQHIPKAAVR